MTTTSSASNAHETLSRMPKHLLTNDLDVQKIPTQSDNPNNPKTIPSD